MKVGRRQERKSRAMVEREERHLQTATYPAFFHLACCHHDNACVLLPHHLPQVIDCGVQAALAGDVGLGALIWADQGVLSADRGASGGLQEQQTLPCFGTVLDRHAAVFQESHLDIVGIDVVRSGYVWVPSLEDDSGVINWGCSERMNSAMRYSMHSHTELLTALCHLSHHSQGCPVSSALPLWVQTNLTPSSHPSASVMDHRR